MEEDCLCGRLRARSPEESENFLLGNGQPGRGTPPSLLSGCGWPRRSPQVTLHFRTACLQKPFGLWAQSSSQVRGVW